MARLLVEKGHDRGKFVSLSSTSTIIIGRDTSADLQLRDGMASRMHFKIEPRADGPWIIDLDSLNGTLLNNHPVKESALAPGDLIKVGDTLFSFIADDAPSIDSLIGLRIGGYKVLERVGRGGMGTVYKAEQVDLQRIVALKVISKEHLQNREFVELFVHEARAAAKLNHPNIVQVYDVKKQGDLYYFSMEFVPGGNVQELLTKERRLPVERALQMILESARGLEYAHKKGIIHRDIKPDNLMISESNSIKIGDLGLAQRIGEKLSADEESSVIGTPHYIAPEQVLGKLADFRSDIYSLGSTMYRMIAGVTPFQAPGVRDLINKKVREEAPLLHQSTPDVPAAVSLACARMMARLPEKRYASMTEVIADLERYQRQTTSVAIASEKAPSSRVEAPAANRKLLVAAIAMMSVIVLVAGIGAMVVMSKGPTPSPLAADPDSSSERDANRALDTAKKILINYDPRNESKVQQAIKEFSDVVERYPGTKAAAVAQREALECEKQLRNIRAQFEMGTIEELDKTQWTKVAQNFQGGVFDLSPVDTVIKAYEAFSSGPAGKGTSSAEDAMTRARHVRRWTDLVNRSREEFMAVKGEARIRLDQRRFQEAWDFFERFKTATQGSKLACDFAEHYTTLLFDTVAWSEQQKISMSAEADFYKVENDSRSAADRSEFDRAIELLKPVIEHSIPDIQMRARAMLGKLESRHAEFTLKEEARRELERRKMLEEDQRSFNALALEIRALNVKFDFKKALARVNDTDDRFPRTDEYRDRLKDRVAHQSRLLEFKARFMEVYNDPANGQRVGKTWKESDTDTGTLVRVTETALVIRIGGEFELGFSNITPLKLVTFFRGSWRKPPASFIAGMAAFCIESGLYEQALEELAALVKADPAQADWAAAARKMIEAGESTDSPELEAQRRWQRIKDILALTDLHRRPDLMARASADLDLLRKRYADTEWVGKRKKELDDFDVKLKKAGGDQLDLDRKNDYRRKIKEWRNKEKALLEKHVSEVSQLLRNRKLIVNDSDRNYHLGELLAASQNIPLSTDTLLEARKALGQPRDELPQDEREAQLKRFLSISVSLLRNAVITGNPGQVKTYTDEALARLNEWPGRPAEEWAAAYREFETWRENHAKGKKDGLRTAMEAFEKNPDEADPLWTLARVYEATYDMVDAAGYYRALIKEFPDDDRVRSGEALFRLAECTFALRAVPLAAESYQELQLDKKSDLSDRDLQRLKLHSHTTQELSNQLFPGRDGRKPRKEKPDKSE